MIYKTLHRKLKTEQHKTNQKPGENSGAMEGLGVLAPLVIPVMLPKNDTNMIRYRNRVGLLNAQINTNNRIKQEAPTKEMRVKRNRTYFSLK